MAIININKAIMDHIANINIYIAISEYVKDGQHLSIHSQSPTSQIC
jgi:hypothetical protein